MRNGVDLKECLEESYLNGQTTRNANPRKIIPNDPEIPQILNRVSPCQEIVKIDYFLPGCPPRADLIWNALTALITDNPIELPYEMLKFD